MTQPALLRPQEVVYEIKVENVCEKPTLGPHGGVHIYAPRGILKHSPWLLLCSPSALPAPNSQVPSAQVPSNSHLEIPVMAHIPVLPSGLRRTCPSHLGPSLHLLSSGGFLTSEHPCGIPLPSPAAALFMLIHLGMRGLHLPPSIPHHPHDLLLSHFYLHCPTEMLLSEATSVFHSSRPPCQVGPILDQLFRGTLGLTHMSQVF